MVAFGCGSAITDSGDSQVAGEDAASMTDVDVSSESLEADVVPDGGDGGDTGPVSAQVCPPGLSGCVEGNLLICNETGSAFELVKCDSGMKSPVYLTASVIRIPLIYPCQASCPTVPLSPIR
ncbi:MAG: hypothetical protein QF464_16015, partial [Myxococcota bacterium]|nr:hypothetical protein [Myxococcota bacterium]